MVQSYPTQPQDHGVYKRHNNALLGLGPGMLCMDSGMFLSALWCLDHILYGYGSMRMQVAIPGTL